MKKEKEISFVIGGEKRLFFYKENDWRRKSLLLRFFGLEF